MSRLSKVFALICLALITLFTVRFVLLLQGLDGWLTRIPQWDPSAHALDSIHFARAFRHLSLKEFFVQLHNSAMWPPVIPLLQAPFHFFFGESILTARNWTAWTTLPTLSLVFVVGTQAHRKLGLLVGAIATGLLFISPLFEEHALQEMFEIPGIGLCMVTLFFYFRFLNTSQMKYWRWTCLSAILLFFAKFNYAVLIMLPIVASEFFSKVEFRTLVIAALKRFVRDVRWRSAFTIFVGLYIVFLIYVQKVGLRFEVFGQLVVIQKAFGNPLYLLLAIVLVRNWIRNRDLLKLYARSIGSAPEPIRSLLRFDILPALVWMSYPVFFLHFFLYMFNEKTRHNSFWSLETLTFYPGAILRSYSPSPVLGAISCVLFVLMLVSLKKLPKISRFVTCLALFNLFLTVIHPNYQIRYLMTFIPLLYLTTALAIAHALELIFMKAQRSLETIAALCSAPVLLVLCTIWTPSHSYLQDAFIRTSQSEASRAIFHAICQDSTQTEKNTVVGFSNYISPSSIALTCYEDFPQIRREQLPTAMGRLGFPNEKSGRAIVESGTIDRYFVIDYARHGINPGRLQENFLLDDVKAALKSSPYTESLLIDQGEGGLALTVFRKQ
ncbi:MAG: hypothetical protein EOP10_15330 [Proteobacteria bacterium]|nr:MAG: hypothetical protein EOP10_15330 [Pseudomonadota bacterium]